MKKSLESIRNSRSKKDFPFLDLEEGEYVELAIKRTNIVLFFIWFFAIVSILLLILTSFSLPNIFYDDGMVIFVNREILDLFSFIIFVLYFLIFAIALIATKIHFDNKLFVTNKRVIQLIVPSLFSRSTNVVELTRIEDVSFKQDGIVQNLFNYGTIRMSTVGDETTYTFPFVSTPTDEVQTISHLIHVTREKEAKKS